MPDLGDIGSAVKRGFSPGGLKRGAEAIRFTLFGGRSPLEGQPPDLSQIRSPTQARFAIDSILGMDYPESEDARAIDYLRNQGGLERVVETAARLGLSPTTPLSPEGVAMSATGNFAGLDDTWKTLDQHLDVMLAGNEQLALTYMRRTEPMTLLPLLVEQDTDRLGSESSNVVKDLWGRLLGGAKAVFLNPWTSPMRLENMLGALYYNDVPDAHLRWEMGKRFYDLKGTALFGVSREREARAQANELVAQGLTGEAAARKMEQWFQENPLGAGGMLADLTGQIIFDPLWLFPFEKAAGVITKPVKVAGGAEKLSQFLRLTTPAGRKVAGQDGIRSLMQMSEASYAQHKLASPSKGLSRLLFSKTPSTFAESAKNRLGQNLVPIFNSVRTTDDLVRVVKDVNTTFKTGNLTGVVKERIPQVLGDPDIAEFAAIVRQRGDDIIDDDALKAVTEVKQAVAPGDLARAGIDPDDAVAVESAIRAGTVRAEPAAILQGLPLDNQRIVLDHLMSSRIRTIALKAQDDIWKDTASGRFLMNRLFPFNAEVRKWLGIVTLNTPGFAHLNMVSNLFRHMWQAGRHPLIGLKTAGHSLWTETGSILTKGGQYTDEMMRILRPTGLSPIDVERFVANQSGTREIFDRATRFSDDALKVAADDTVGVSQDSVDLLRRAAGQPVKHIGEKRHLRDAITPFIYGTSRIDNAFRRATFLQALARQGHIATGPSKAAGGRLVPPIVDDLVRAGVDPQDAARTEDFIRDRMEGMWTGRHDLPAGKELLDDEVIESIFTDAAKAIDQPEAANLLSGSYYSRRYYEEVRGFTGEDLISATNDVAPLANRVTAELLPRIGKDLTPEEAERILRQWVQEYFDMADIGRQLGHMESTVRPGTTYSTTLRYTDQAMREEMVDTVDLLERYMKTQFFGTAWTDFPHSGLSRARQYHSAAERATVGNANRLAEIRKVYDDFANRGTATVAGDTPIPDELVAKLPDELKAGRAAAAPQAVPPPPPAPGPAVLPRGLQGAKPRFNIGRRSFDPRFESDVDKSLFIVAQTKKSRRDEDYMRFLRSALPGASDTEIRNAGRQVRARIKDLANAQGTPGPLRIPDTGVRPGRVAVAAPSPPTPVGGDEVVVYRGVRGGGEGDIADASDLPPGKWWTTDYDEALSFADGDPADVFSLRIKRTDLPSGPEAGDQFQLSDRLTKKAVRPRVTLDSKGRPIVATPRPLDLGTGPGALTTAQLWDNYFSVRDRTWAEFFDEAERMVEGNVPAGASIRRVREQVEETFKFHRETVNAARGSGSDDTWREAARRIGERYQANRASRSKLISPDFPANDPARAQELLDGTGPLAQEVNDFTEWMIPRLREDTARIARGEMRLGQPADEVLRTLANDAKGRLSESRQIMIANARAETDFVMLNYNNQYGIDQVIKTFIPFWFWPSREAVHWGIRAARQPGMVGALTLAMTAPNEYMKQYGYPERLRQRIPIYMPFLDDMMKNIPILGDRLASGDYGPYYWVDPVQMVFPYRDLTRNFDDPERRNTPLGRALDVFENYSPMSFNPFMKIIGSETGLLDRDAWRSFGFQGGPFGIPITPAAREVGRWFYEGDETAIPTEEQELYAERGRFSKGLMGRVLGLAPNKYDVYRAERALWTLATTNQLLPGKDHDEQIQAAWEALDTHSGPAWKNAVKAAESETFLKQLTGYIGFPAGQVTGVNEGETIWFGLRAAYSEAARRGRLEGFFEKYPEFEIRSAVVKGLSDPQEKQAAVDTELYYESLDRVVEKQFSVAERQLVDELDKMRNMEQLQPVRDQIEIIESQLKEINQEKKQIREVIERAFPLWDKEPSLNQDPRDRALRKVRSAWFDITWDEGSEPFEAFTARREAFIRSFPASVDPVAQEDVWHELSRESLLTKISYGRQIDRAIDEEDFNSIETLIEERDGRLEALHAQAEQMITQRDANRFLTSFARQKTPEEREFETADAQFDLWMSLVSSGAPFTGREKASISEYFKSLPEIQKFYPLQVVDLDDLTLEQRMAVMQRREFWRTYHAISDPDTQLDYYYSVRSEIVEANALLGLPTPTPIDVARISPEFLSDPLIGHVEMMAALHQRAGLEEDGASPEEVTEIQDLLTSYGAEGDTYGGLTAQEVDEILAQASS